MISRRSVLAGGTALALASRTARATTAGLRQALDAASAERDPAAALRILAPFDPVGLLPGAQLDVITARAGLAVDAEIVARFAVDPRGKPSALRDPAYLALLLRRKLGDGFDVANVVARLQHEHTICDARAEILFDRIGVARGTTGARFSALWNDTPALYQDSDAGRDAAIADMNRSLARFRSSIPDLIGSVPAYCLDVSALRPTSADLATGHVGVRGLPAPGKPGFYIVDLTHVRDRPRWTLPSVVAHELLPGHMVQMPLEAAADPHPLRQEYASAFVEGWGIYAERAIMLSSAYRNDPRAELGYLHWRLFRIGRALVDLAIQQGMPLDAARARLVAWQGEPVAFAPFDKDLERIARDPMTRVAEMMAAITIEDAAQGRTGESLRRYHHAILSYGRMRSDEVGRRTRTL